MKARSATVKRITKETSINLTVNLDGEGKTDVNTGYGMADHLLTLIGFWACFDLKVTCTGDLDIDAHHTVEDVAFCLGQAVLEALGDRKGIRRVGFAKVPMDEAIADVAVDLSGRAQLVYNGDDLLPPLFAGEERDLWREFFKALAAGARLNLHINYLYGKNGHHLLESAGKGLGLSLRDAVRGAGDGVSSTKGSLD